MTTLAALTDKVLAQAYGARVVERPQSDTMFTTSITSGTTEIRMDTESLWRRGDLAEFQSDGEIFEFTENHPSAATATVRRGTRWGNAAGSQSAGAVVYRNPVFPIKTVEQLINETVRDDLWPEVWSWHNGTISFSTSTEMYSLPQYVEDVARLYQYNLNSASELVPIQRTAWDVERNLNTAVATNGAAIRIRGNAIPDDTATLYYDGMRRPHPDDLANLDDRLADLVVYGVLGKLDPVARAIAVQHPARGSRNSQKLSETLQTLVAFTGLFRQNKADIAETLKAEIPLEPRFRPRRRRQRWT